MKKDSNNWYSSYHSNRHYYHSSNKQANHTKKDSHSSGSNGKSDLSPFKLIKERFKEDPLVFVAEVAFAASLFFFLYAALWLGAILGLS